MTLQTNASALVAYISHHHCPLKISQLRELRINRAISYHQLPAAAAMVMKGASRSLESFIWVLNMDFGAHRVPGKIGPKLMFESPGFVPESRQSHPSSGLQDLVSPSSHLKNLCTA